MKEQNVRVFKSVVIVTAVNMSECNDKSTTEKCWDWANMFSL